MGRVRILQLPDSEIDSPGLQASLAEAGRQERRAGLGQELHFSLPLAVGKSRQLEILGQQRSSGFLPGPFCEPGDWTCRRF